jgi:hypothetical protein
VYSFKIIIIKWRKKMIKVKKSTNTGNPFINREKDAIPSRISVCKSGIFAGLEKMTVIPSHPLHRFYDIYIRNHHGTHLRIYNLETNGREEFDTRAFNTIITGMNYYITCTKDVHLYIIDFTRDVFGCTLLYSKDELCAAIEETFNSIPEMVKEQKEHYKDLDTRCIIKEIDEIFEIEYTCTLRDYRARPYKITCAINRNGLLLYFSIENLFISEYRPFYPELY